MNTALVTQKFDHGGEEAAALLRDLASGRNEVLLAIRGGSAESALTAISRREGRSGALALTGKGEADAVDAVVDQLPPEEGRRLLKSCFTDERRAEVLAGRGDLSSTAVFLAEPEDVVAAIVWDVNGLGLENPAATSLQVFAWMGKIREHDRFEEILDHEVGAFTVREHALVACLYASGVGPEYLSEDGVIEGEGVSSENETRILQSMYEAGLEDEEDLLRLRDMQAEGRLPRFDDGEVQSAKRAIAERRKRLEQTPTLAEQVRERAEDAASVLDF